MLLRWLAILPFLLIYGGCASVTGNGYTIDSGIANTMPSAYAEIKNHIEKGNYDYAMTMYNLNKPKLSIKQQNEILPTILSYKQKIHVDFDRQIAELRSKKDLVTKIKAGYQLLDAIKQHEELFGQIEPADFSKHKDTINNLIQESEVMATDTVYKEYVLGKRAILSKDEREYAKRLRVPLINACKNELASCAECKITFNRCKELLLSSDKEELIDARLGRVSLQKDSAFTALNKYAAAMASIGLDPIEPINRNFLKKYIIDKNLVRITKHASENDILPNDTSVYLKIEQPNIKEIQSSTKITSNYKSGVSRELNPNYANIEREYRQVVSDRSQCMATYIASMATNSNALNFCFLYDGKINGLLNSLERTPMYSNVAQSSKYYIDISEKEFTRSGNVKVIMSNGKKYSAGSCSISDSKKFKLAGQLHPEDEAYKISDFSTSEDIQRYLETDIRFDDVGCIFSTLKNLQPFGGSNGSNENRAFKEKIDPSNIIEDMEERPSKLDLILDNSVVIIKAQGAIGSGFFVQNKYILTNAHVVSNETIVQIKGRTTKDSTGVVVAVDDKCDLALVASSINGIPLRLADKHPFIGEMVFALGHPGGLEFSATKGIVSARRKLNKGTVKCSVVQTDAPISPGNSGGPLLTVNGDVVGVSTFKHSGDLKEGLGFAIDGEEVAKFLNRYLPH